MCQIIETLKGDQRNKYPGITPQSYNYTINAELRGVWFSVVLRVMDLGKLIT